MQNQNPINWFELPAADLERATAFYAFVLDCEFTLHDMGPLKMAWFPSVQGGNGATGALVEAEPYTPSYEGALIYFAVEDIETALAKIEEKGGKTINPKRGIGEYGFVAHFEDTEGNRVALHAMQ